jgi:hypothetical protein
VPPKKREREQGNLAGGRVLASKCGIPSSNPSTIKIKQTKKE